MDDILILNKDNFNNILGRLLSQGFYKDFTLSKSLVLDFIDFSKENNIQITGKNIQKIKDKYEMSYHTFINNDNFSNLFPVRNKREQLNLLNTLMKQKSFSCFKLDKDLSNIVINYFKHNQIFIKHNFFQFLSNFNK
tara:strand:+ start:2824 stop:3234 length:411 start_codon:yes stop_codon:yes gene_type:complete